MASELWGPAAGISQRRQEDAQQALAEMAMRRGEVGLQQDVVNLESSQIALGAQQRMLELMRGKEIEAEDSKSQAPPSAGAFESDDIPNSLNSLAKMAMQAGLPQQAAEYADKASTLRNNASLIREREGADRMRKLNIAANLLSTVGDETSWRRANALYTMETGEPSPFAEMDYSPENVAMIRDTVVTEKDRALTNAAKAREQASLASAEESTVRKDLINAQADLARTRATVLNKVGAVGKQPKAEDLRAVSDIINSEFLGAVTPEDARILARPVAERMLQLMGEANISRSQAARRAFNEAQARGDFGGLRKRRRMSGDISNPIEMPSTQDALRPNMYYKGKGKYAGQTLLWSGTGFRVVDVEAERQAAAELIGEDEQSDSISVNEEYGYEED